MLLAKQFRLKSCASSLKKTSLGRGGGSSPINSLKNSIQCILDLTTALTRTSCMTAMPSFLGQGRLPAHIWCVTHPKLQISTFPLYPSRSALRSDFTTSGAHQKIEPCKDVCSLFRYTSSTRLERPKSEILQIPLGSTKMLSGFISYETH